MRNSTMKKTSHFIVRALGCTFCAPLRVLVHRLRTIKTINRTTTIVPAKP